MRKGSEADEPSHVQARRITLSGPANDFDDRGLMTTASVFHNFARQPGHIGGHVLVNRESGHLSATSFWDSRSDAAPSMENVENSAARMCELMWGDLGAWRVEVFEVIAFSPPSRAVDLPEL